MSGFAGRPAFALGALALIAGLAISSMTVINENEQAVVTRMGEPDRVLNRWAPDRAPEGGLAAHLPLVERVIRVPRGFIVLTDENEEIRSVDQQNLIVDADVTYRVFDPAKMVRTTGGPEQLAERLRAPLPALLRDQLATVPAARIAMPGSGGASQQLRAALDGVARALGAQVVDVRLSQVRLTQGGMLDAFEQMRERHEANAAEVRAEGAREVQLITSEAEAEAARIMQASAGRDPEFYDFYRALRSYEAVMGDPAHRNRATIVLPPDSGYLKQFNAP